MDEVDAHFFPLSWVVCVELGGCIKSCVSTSSLPSVGVSKSTGNTPEEGVHAKFPVAAVSLNMMSNRSTLSKPFSRNFAASSTSYNFTCFINV
jgi:hypothetical protein